MDILRTGARIGAALSLGGALVAPAPAQTLSVDMTAARAGTGEKSEVRLLWIVTQGWLPATGVNVYRSDHPEKPLNETPILLDPRLLSGDAKAKINAPVANRPLFGAGIAARSAPALSSWTAFSAFKGEVQRLQATPGVRGSQIAAQAAKAPDVVSFRDRLQPPRRVVPTAAAPLPLTDDEQTVSARIQALLAALTSYSAAQKIGLAYVDKTARPGVTYTYTLRAAGGGTASLAQVVVPTGETVMPPAPTGLDSVQTGQTSVALHWEPITAGEEQTLSSATYNVFRDGVRLNKSPIRIPFLLTKDGAHIAPMTSFIDSGAPLGTLRYTVTLTDAFGRTSAPAPVTVTMTDLRVPAPIPKVAAAVSKSTPGALRVYWVAPDIYSGDIGITVSPTLTQIIPDTTTAVYRSEDGRPETAVTLSAPSAVLTDMNTVTGAIPADIADLTVADLLALVPDFEAGLASSGLVGDATIPKSLLDTFRDQSIDKLYARLNLFQKQGLYTVTRAIRSYLDTTPAVDKDYRYHLAPAYVVNPAHFGTGAYSVSLAVPTTAIPASPAGFGGAFAKGTGKFGFVEGGAAPTIRRVGIADAEVEKPRVVEKNTATGTNAKRRKKAADAPPLKTIAGRVTLRWQATAFSSPVRYKIYRAAATGLFPTAQTAMVGAPPVLPNVSLSPKVGAAQRPSIKTIMQQRHQLKATYSPNFAAVPMENYALLTVTDKTEFVDALPVSQRMHYDYRIVPVSRWGVEGPATTVADVLIPATLPPSLPTLLKAQVDENVADGHVRLTISANPPDENVTKYLIFRKALIPLLLAAGRERVPVRVVSARGFALPPVTTQIAPGRARNLSIQDLKANNSALFRHLLEPEGYVKVGEAPVSASQTFVDTTGRARVPFAYQVVAVNGDNIASKPSSPLDATALKVACDPPRGFTGALSAGEDAASVTLTWQAPAPDAPAHYVLERSVGHLTAQASGTGVFVTLAGDLAPGETRFKDSDVRSGRRYTYRLRAVDSEGLFSAPQTQTVIVPTLAAANFPALARSEEPPGTRPLPRPATDPAPAPVPIPVPVPTPGTGIAAAQPASRRARFGESYLVSTGGAFAVRVEKAAYSLDSYAIDAENFYYCRPDERFVRLTLRVKNVSGQDQTFDYQSVTAHTIAADNTALADTKNWKALDTGRLASRTVAPGGEFVVEGVVVAPGETAPLALAFGDCVFPLSDGANALAPLDAASEQPAAVGTRCPLAYTTATVESAARVGADYVVTVTARNASLAPLTLGPNSLMVEVFDTDGDKYAAEPGQIARATLAPGASARLRFVFKVPKAAPVHQIKLREKDSRVYVLSGEK